MQPPRPPPDSSAVTVNAPHPTAAPVQAQGPLSAGFTLAGRYRIIALLGKGGMGEVYRADDLELGASVALKFLPPALSSSPAHLERFRSEVRLARQISHPNVVRVFDLSQSDGRTFLSMEYVDGEDLGSLLRRIGRLPQDKAVQIARQLCFALGASHDLGVIHRDLKPANIMIDGRGNARIMDFGVAGIAAQLMAAGDVMSGTPAYMAPEQLSGKEVSKKSDLYSLGLVLYELFTGKPAFLLPAGPPDEQGHPTRPPLSLADLRRIHQTSTRPENLSSHVHDLDPAIERVVLRCLEPDPDRRPSSAVAIAASLPGGDPLAAALAAGETPSPELIAASGHAQTISPLQAWGRAAAIAAALLIFLVITAPWTMISRVKPAKSPEVLQDRSIEVLRAMGYTDPPADSARGINAREAFISDVNLSKDSGDRVTRMQARPGPYEFWYRQSPYPIDAADRDGMIRYLSPFPSQSGEAIVRMDTSGRLEYLAVIPPRKRSDTSTEIPETNIKRLFEFADLDLTRFTPVDPIIRSFVPIDVVKSWTGASPEQPDLPIRVHIGVVEGRVAYFSVAYPWTIAAIEASPRPPQPTSALDYGAGALLALVIAATCRLAWKNLQSSRGDRAGALRLSGAMFAFAALNLAVVQHRLPGPRAILGEGGGFGAAAFAAIEFWLFYIALEPYARRVYPQALVSWTRVLRAQFNDPLVGRHILLGLMFGTGSVLCTGLFTSTINSWVLPAPHIAMYGRTNGYLGGWPVILALTSDVFVSSMMIGAGSMLILVTGELAFKRRWAGYAMLVLALAALEINVLRQNPIDGVIEIIIVLIPVLAIRWGGMLALVITHMAILLGQMLPVGLDWTHWFAAPVWIPAAILAGLTILGARSASMGRSVPL